MGELLVELLWFDWLREGWVLMLDGLVRAMMGVRTLLAQAAEAAPAGQQAAQDGGGFLQQFLGNPINLVLFSLILFFLLVAQPQRKQMKKQQQMLAGIKKNDRVITSGGIHGVVVVANSGESTVSIRVDDNSGTRITINRESIATVVAPSSETAK